MIPLSANPTKWSNTLKQFVGEIADELFECVWPFYEIGAKRIMLKKINTTNYSKWFCIDIYVLICTKNLESSTGSFNIVC